MSEEAGTRGAALRFWWDYGHNQDDLVAERIRIAVKNAYFHSWSGGWPTAAPLTLDRLSEWTLRASRRYGSVIAGLLLERAGAVLSVSRNRTGFLSLNLTTASHDSQKQLLLELRERFPEVEPGPQELVATFWYGTASGSRSDTRTLSAPAFAEIAPNYQPQVRAEIDRLIDPRFVPGEGGKLLLWYGPPGCGKTYALRALVREWSAWCHTSYITDPEVFFREASYMSEVLLYSPSADRPAREDEPSENKENKKERWHLVLLEDCGELLASDAARVSGQGFSRLLNVSDGLLGTSLRVLLLVTTNEDIQRLHPAVTRPGRCVSRIEFGPLDAPSANEWLRAHGMPPTLTRSQTVAELYALANRWRTQTQPPRRVGFRTT